MVDYQILKITINKKNSTAKIYFRRELVGSLALGGNFNPPYPKEKIVGDHAARVRKFGLKASLLDKAAAEAETIDVEILQKDELRNSTVADADRVKRILIAKFKEENLDWRKRLLNMK